MYSQIYNISSEFGIKPNNITRLKYFYIIHCGKDLYSLYAARPSAEKIMFLHGVKEGLIKNGFTSLDRYITARDGLPYTVADGTVYTMTEFNGLNELDFLNNDQCLKAVSAIGRMHSASARFKADEPPVKKYENGIERLVKIKKKFSSKKNPSDMDFLMCKMYQKSIDCAAQSLDILKKCGFDDGESIYIHNSLKEDNLIYHRGRVHIIDWDNAKAGSPMEDIAFFVRRYIRKNAYYAHIGNIGYLTLNELLCAYDCENKLTQCERDIFYALLQYPSRYIGVMDDYYKKQRSFVPASMGRKAEEICSQWDFTMDYISK